MNRDIIIADDHPLFRVAMVNVLNRLPGHITVHEVESFAALECYLQSRSTPPNLLLLDLKLPDTNGLNGLLSLKKNYQNLPVAVISAYDDDSIIAQIRDYGALGFVSKSLQIEAMLNSIEKLLAGESCFPDCSKGDCDERLTKGFRELTPNQLKVLQLLKDGKPSKTIAATLGVTEATIKAHLTTIFKKLGVRNRTQAVIAANQLELPDEFEARSA